MTLKGNDIDWGTGTSSPDPDTWGFQSTKSGTRHSNLHNIGVAVDHDPTLQRLVWYDEFLDRLLTGPTGREWTDEDDTGIAMRLQDDYNLTRASVEHVRMVLARRAKLTPRHVIREYLQSLTWDRVDRIALAFEDHWGCETGPDQPEDYLRAASANFFIGMVARILRPGCKLDTMPVFEGPQGALKSTALEALAGKAFFTVQHESVTTKDFFQIMTGKWLIEIAELDSFGRAEITRVKSVMSTSVDRYRASYGRTALDHARQSVFAGTTNRDDWGRDETGLRRFWPIRCGTINLATLRETRDQLFAEALVRLADRATWWDMPQSTLLVQADRQAESPLCEALLPWLAMNPDPTTLQILHECLKIEPGKITRLVELEMGRAMRMLGYVKKNLLRNGRQAKRWVDRSAPFLDITSIN